MSERANTTGDAKVQLYILNFQYRATVGYVCIYIYLYIYVCIYQVLRQLSPPGYFSK